MLFMYGIDKDYLKEAIADQRSALEEKFRKERMITRSLSLSNFLKHNGALFILGVRRCGKSILAAQLFGKEKFGYVSFDDERLAGIRAKDLDVVLQSLYELYGTDLENLVFDEIQNVKGWELFISRVRDTKKVIVTGSNAKLLAGELATHMTGRHIDAMLYPFSFAEFLDYRSVAPPSVPTTKDKAMMSNLAMEYLGNGGFPEVQKYGAEMAKNIFNDIITKDVALRHGVKNVTALNQLALFLLSNISNDFTYRSLKGITSVHNLITLSNWVRWIEDSYLLFHIEKFSSKLRQVILSPKKLYAIDQGMSTAMGFKTGDDKGRLMENAVAVELMRRKNSTRAGMEIYYWQDYRQHKVDFVVKKGSGVHSLIQVTYSTSIEGIKKRETENLIDAGRELRCSNLICITWDYEAKEKKEGKTINFIPLWKWLLQKPTDPAV